jgi:hypothetical protein
MIALDADGFSLDYSSVYAKAWTRSLRSHPAERVAHGTQAVERLAGEYCNQPAGASRLAAERSSRTETPIQRFAV